MRKRLIRQQKGTQWRPLFFAADAAPLRIRSVNRLIIGADE
jgi:hypothetical protein